MSVVQGCCKAWYDKDVIVDTPGYINVTKNKKLLDNAKKTKNSTMKVIRLDGETSLIIGTRR